MTDSQYSHITIIADRSGSMSAIRSDAEGAINAFIADQQKVEGRASLLLVDFDTLDPFNVVHNGDLVDAPFYSLNPRGGTPLRDAIGKGIALTGEKLAALDEADRPAHVFFVIQTDGMENSSKEWTQEAINAAIKTQEDQFAWTFVFLATGPSAWSAGEAFKGTQMHTSNTVHNSGGGHSHGVSMGYTGQNIAATRGGQRVASYAGNVDDEGNITERTE